ncbi:branched-chain amino acid transporter permease [Aerococcus urinae]|uniref:branched-chain amino acid transporter permease n=1 Tax=Aerococcus mictus TaxID=2976810 RepID=UPI001244AB08|nr:AzlD domain-containing protein [Aerococcus mictus]KAA9233251.1 branched-chain amino acid transporter AzlD [Aerococcus mictus]
MTFNQQLITVILLALGTALTRFIVFVVFSKNQVPPRFVTYLGKVLPAAAISLLVVYSLQSSNPLAYPYALPELIAILVTILLQAKTHRSLLSIAGGTLSYMFLVQVVFP